MQVALYVPINADLSVALEEYPDLEDEYYEEDGFRECWIGSSVEDGDDEWMTYEEAIAFCGFCEGAVKDAETLIEGNGGWAQSMLRTRDFSLYAFSDADKAAWKAKSDIYFEAFERGKKAAASALQQ